MLAPLTEAVRSISTKTPVGSALRSAAWSAVPVALRMRSQFSAGVESLHVLQSVQDRMVGLIKLESEKVESGKTATFDRSSFIDSIRKIAREEGLDQLVDPTDRGTIRDITSIPRLGMIFDMQKAMAQGFARWKGDQNEGALLLYPAWEFKRVAPRKMPRQNWPERWVHAGGKIVGDPNAPRMVALKNDSVWEKLSAFGTPWPPFDFNSGMGLEDVDYDDAVNLGLLKDGDVPEPRTEEFNAGLQASVQGLGDEMKKFLQEAFPGQVVVQKGTAWWKGDKAGKDLAKPPKPKPVVKPAPAVPPAQAPVPAAPTPEAPTPAPPAASAEPPAFPTSLDQVETERRLGGSTGAELVRDKQTGARYVLKRGNSAGHLREEFAADRIYQALGIDVPEAVLLDGQKPTKLARFIEGQNLGDFLQSGTGPDRAAVLAQVKEAFVADAFLGNWDVAGLGLDNILVDRKGKAWRIDNGGSLRFRAQGARKTPDQWGPVVTELDTLRDPSINPQTAKIFGDLTEADIQQQIEKLLSAEKAILAAAPVDLRKDLAARLQSLRKRLPAKGGTFSPEFAQEIREARIVGKSAPTDRGDIEDAQVLYWEELDTQGNPVLKATMKLTPTGSDKVWDRIKSQAADPTDLFDEESVFQSVVKAAKTVNHHQSDGNYNLQTLDALEAAKMAVEKAVREGAISAAGGKPYLNWISEIRQAAATKAAAPQVSKIGLQVNVPNQPGNIDAKKVANLYQAKRTTRGRVRQVDGKVFEASTAYDINVEGAKVRFKPFTPSDKSFYTLQGRFEVEVSGGATPEGLEKIAKAMSQLGLDSRPAQPDFQEALSLFKGLNLRRDLVTVDRLNRARAVMADEALKDAEKVIKLRNIATESGMPIIAGKAFKPGGLENGFGQGLRTWWRWDLTRVETEKAMKNYVISHRSSAKPEDLLGHWLDQGGVASPVAERLRRGVDISGGMSPLADLNNGTSDYLFTRIVQRSKAKAKGQWHFKIGNLARLDALSYKGDWLGGVHTIYKPEARQNLAVDPAGWRQYSRSRANETLFKDGLNLLDELDAIVVNSEAERQRVLVVFKTHGIERLNDGRKVEEIVIAP